MGVSCDVRGPILLFNEPKKMGARSAAQNPQDTIDYSSITADYYSVWHYFAVGIPGV